jgi:nucleoside-diphosphate-sugar epimerase
MTAGRVLVTGGGGFVGRQALLALLAQSFEVHTVSRHPLRDAPMEVQQHRGDLLDTNTTAGLVDRIQPTHLLHLAWTVTPGQFWRATDNLDFVSASLLLYRAFVQAGGRRVVVAGTCAEYDWTHDVLDEETTPCRPTTLYGVAKDGLHRILAAAARQDGVSLAWGRLFFLYGPHEAAARLVPDVTLSLLRGQPALCGNGMALRDFMAVEDVAGALVATLVSDYVGPVNIASGQCQPLRNVIMIIAELIGRVDLVRMGARVTPPDDPVQLAATTAVLNDKVGYHPVWTLQAGLAATVAWWRAREAAALA